MSSHGRSRTGPAEPVPAAGGSRVTSWDGWRPRARLYEALVLATTPHAMYPGMDSRFLRGDDTSPHLIKVQFNVDKAAVGRGAVLVVPSSSRQAEFGWATAIARSVGLSKLKRSRLEHVVDVLDERVPQLAARGQETTVDDGLERFAALPAWMVAVADGDRVADALVSAAPALGDGYHLATIPAPVGGRA
jgi:hypothetical protein